MCQAGPLTFARIVFKNHKNTARYFLLSHVTNQETESWRGALSKPKQLKLGIGELTKVMCDIELRGVVDMSEDRTKVNTRELAISMVSVKSSAGTWIVPGSCV